MGKCFCSLVVFLLKVSSILVFSAVLLGFFFVFAFVFLQKSN